jgi:hypothetical protein
MVLPSSALSIGSPCARVHERFAWCVACPTCSDQWCVPGGGIHRSRGWRGGSPGLPIRCRVVHFDPHCHPRGHRVSVVGHDAQASIQLTARSSIHDQLAIASQWAAPVQGMLILAAVVLVAHRGDNPSGQPAAPEWPNVLALSLRRPARHHHAGGRSDRYRHGHVGLGCSRGTAPCPRS